MKEVLVRKGISIQVLLLLTFCLLFSHNNFPPFAHERNRYKLMNVISLSVLQQKGG